MELTQKYSPTEKFALGKEEGRKWAYIYASPEELQRLADARDPIFGWGIEAAGNGITAGDIIASILNGYMMPHAFEVMLSFGLDDFVDDPDFVTGFAEGCLIVRKWDLEAEAERESAGNLYASADTPASACQTPATAGVKPLNTYPHDNVCKH